MMQGRIWFEGNPWPGGHAIKSLSFSLLLDDQGLGLLLDLVSDDYYAEDPTYWDNDEDEAEADSGWQSKAVWGNYHACHLSNTYWGFDPATVPRVDGTLLPINPAMCAPLRFSVDPVALGAKSDKDHDQLGFHIYLTGHDAVAAHAIALARQDDGHFTLHWSGLIAEAYVGDDHFRHPFRAEASGVAFDGFMIRNPMRDGDWPKALQPSPEAREAKARALAARFIKDADQLKFVCGKGADPDYLKI